MVDLEPFLEAPFEEASNRSFEALLMGGIGLLVAVAALGRSTLTTALVAIYLLSIPAYVAYRIRVWDGGETAGDDAEGTDGETEDTETENSDPDTEAETGGADPEPDAETEPETGSEEPAG